MTSARAEITVRRSYSRPIEDSFGEPIEGAFESWEDICMRVVDHQKWLWERALTHNKLPDMPLHDVTPDLQEWTLLDEGQDRELSNLLNHIYDRKLLPAGRTLWLGGTEVARRRESSMFNCSFTMVETVYDIVDCFWLLLQGCGVGFSPKVGTLTGFRKPIPDIRVISSTRTSKGGFEHNQEHFHDGVWTISIGDSAEAWAKSIGKLLAGKYEAHTLVFDLSNIRPAGDRLKGYGWISSGDAQIATAYPAIARILNKRAGNLLRKIDLLDILNWLGTVLSSRRSAEICLVDYGSGEWYQFAMAKENVIQPEFAHRAMSNNSLVFYEKPSRERLETLFDMMVKSGGSEPGIVNGDAALKRAPWFSGLNPCGEILLANKSFCNLVEVDVAKFKGDAAGLHHAMELAARMNYRQTVVDFRDGILQESWHLNNEFLRLCGVGVTGIVQRDDLTEYEWKDSRYSAVASARIMAKELKLEHPKNVTTVKPSGTVSKIMDTTEGIHRPPAKYIFNWINFHVTDPMLEKLSAANYEIKAHPVDTSGALVCLPVAWDNVIFNQELHLRDVETHLELNNESALSQLERYKKIQNFYCDHNVSNTIEYKDHEIQDIIDWLLVNSDCYVGVRFLPRQSPTKTAKELGYPYLPQQVVTKEEYEEYNSQLLEIDWSNTGSFLELDEKECLTDVCPIK